MTAPGTDGREGYVERLQRRLCARVLPLVHHELHDTLSEIFEEEATVALREWQLFLDRIRKTRSKNRGEDRPETDLTSQGR